MTTYAPERPPVAVHLRRLYEQLDVTQREIAAAVGATERQVQEWMRVENARYTPSWPTVVKLAAFFSEKTGGVPIDPGTFYCRPV
jgi:DNA-binding XRE family transcriptional regulator